MAVALDPVQSLQHDLEATAADPSLDPMERSIRLREIRERLNDLLGTADRVIANVGQIREAEASEQARQVLWVRENADLREALIAEGEWTADELDEAGFLSHAELDKLAEEGLLMEAVVGVAKKFKPKGVVDLAKFDPAKHPHGMHGKFEDTPDIMKPGAEKTAGAVEHPTVDAQGGPIDPRYKDYFKHDPEAIIAHVSRLRPTRNDTPEHIAKARHFMDKSKAGEMEKRKPLTVTENGDGTLSIIDGNSTHAAATAEGLTHLPVKIDKSVDPGAADDAAVQRVTEEIAAAAEKAEPAVTAALKRVTSDHGGKLEGLDYRLKTRESLARKIKLKQKKYPGMAANEAGARITDAIRYTSVLPSDSYTSGVQETLDALGKAGFKTVMKENYWGGGDDYDGFHANLRGPGGVLVELQFHTPESLTTKEQKNHPIYEKFRTSEDSHERWDLWQQMVSNSALIPMPPGVDELGGAKQHPSPSAPGQMKPAVGGEEAAATKPIKKADVTTSDPKEALAALHAGQTVELSQPSAVSTLLDELHKHVQEMKAKGMDAPNLDLCKVTVKGRNVFCVTHQGIPRLKMPQLEGHPEPGTPAAAMAAKEGDKVDLSDAFREHLKSKGVTITSGTTPASHLRASQRELNGAKVAAIAHALDKGKDLNSKSPLFTSSDDYVVDGHHRWAATVGHHGGQDTPMRTDKVDMPILELLGEANEFTKKMGIRPQAV